MSRSAQDDLPLVSAIVAAYNYGRFLPRTLDSALSQDYPADRLEIVVVDDGSVDDTPEVLADYARRFPGQVRAYRQDNAGYVAATNLAFEHARGDVWALLDADDLWPAQKTIRQVEILQARPEVGAVYGDVEVIDPDDNILRPSHWAHEGVQPLRGSDALSTLLARGNCAAASSIMVRAALRHRFAPIPAAVPYVDWWTVMQVAAVAELEYLHEPRVGYREHGSNLTLGAEGAALARERIKQSMTRRQSLIHGAAGALSPPALVAAWAAVERDALQAAEAVSSVFIDLPRTSPADRQAGELAASHGRALEQRGDLEQALRWRVVAAALDPFDHLSRAAITALGLRLRAGESAGEAVPGARAFMVLADLEQLVPRPERVAAFAQRFAAADDCSLVIHAPGVDAAAVAATLEGVLVAAGVDSDAGPDMIALPDPRLELDPEALERAADARLLDVEPDALRARYAAMRSLAPNAPSPVSTGSST